MDTYNSWGIDHPTMMPSYLFPNALKIDYDRAVRADVSKQNYTVCPRHWYINADFNCGRCGRQFTWTANEQKAWFEHYCFYIDAWPRYCRSCREKIRLFSKLHKEYNAIVGAARNHGILDLKRRIVEIVSELEQEQDYQELLKKMTGKKSLFWTQLPERMIETKFLFQRQIASDTAGSLRT